MQESSHGTATDYSSGFACGNYYIIYSLWWAFPPLLYFFTSSPSCLPTLAGLTFNLNRRPRRSLFFFFSGGFIIFSSLSGTNSSSTAICHFLCQFNRPVHFLSEVAWLCVSVHAGMHACKHAGKISVRTNLQQRALTLVMWILWSLSSLIESLQGQKHFYLFSTFCPPPRPLHLPPQWPANHRWEDWHWVFYFSFWRSSQMRSACDPHASDSGRD